MAYIPKRGDIIHLSFDPASGKEMKGDRYALVMTPYKFNSSGLVGVCPISQGSAEMARHQGFLVTLMGAGTRTQGAIHCHQYKTLDWRVRQARFCETVPDYVIDEVTERRRVLDDPLSE